VKANERAGLLYALSGFATLSIGDAVVKSMAGQWSPTAVAATRYALGAMWLGLLLFRKQGRAGFAMPAPAAQLLRGAGVSMATVGFFSAVYVMPLAEATSITFTSPMITAILAALLLGEPARRSTIVAALVAFSGVLIILRPNFVALG
jgi:drug/metabolite transporter (DMT)-like permease